jgi:hypothetical protein
MEASSGRLSKAFPTRRASFSDQISRRRTVVSTETPRAVMGAARHAALPG